MYTGNRNRKMILLYSLSLILYSLSMTTVLLAIRWIGP
jgi:hypothetical protein